MKKNRLIVYLLLCLCFLLCSGVQSVLGITVGTAVFCPNAFYNPPDTAYEVQLSNAYCNAIKTMFTTKYSDYCYLHIDATVSDYTTRLNSLQNLCDKIVVFSKGHRGIPSANHISLIDHNYDDVIDNVHIYPYTSSYENVFTFIWHCETAEYYPPVGCASMPYCWTHDASLEEYGDAGTKAFLGWENQSPQFETSVNIQYKFAEVAAWFWYYACDGENVEESLDHVAQTIFGVADFSASELDDTTAYHGPLVVWGNMDVELPTE